LHITNQSINQSKLPKVISLSISDLLPVVHQAHRGNEGDTKRKRKERKRRKMKD
jgi:hypothetical protein